MRSKLMLIVAFLCAFGKKEKNTTNKELFSNSLVVIEKSYSYAKSLSLGKPGKTSIKSELDGDTLSIKIFDFPMNCCIDSIGCSPELIADTITIRIKEHLTEICECFTKFDISVKIYPAKLKPSYFKLYKNDAAKPYFEGRE